MSKRFSPLVVSADAVSGFETLKPGTRGGANFQAQTLVYAPAVLFPIDLGLQGIVSVTDAVAFAFSPPTLGGVALSAVAPFLSMGGLILKLTIRNTSGGAHGAGTFNAIFKTAGAVPAIANGSSRSFEFAWNGSNWVEQFRGAADVAN